MNFSKYILGFLLVIYCNISIFSFAHHYEVSEISYKKEVTIIIDKLELAISNFFRKHGINKETISFILTLFQKCEQSNKNPFLQEACKRINFEFLGNIYFSKITISDIKQRLERGDKLNKYYRGDSGKFCLFTDTKPTIIPPCPAKNPLKYGGIGPNVWYTTNNYMFGIGNKAKNEFGLENFGKKYPYVFEGIMIAKKGDTHRQPAFQMKEIGNGIGKGNDTVYLKNRNGKLVIGIMEDYDYSKQGKERESAIFKEFTLQDNNIWKLTECTNRQLILDIDGGDELSYGFSDTFKNSKGKIVPSYKNIALPLSQCENQIKIINLID